MYKTDILTHSYNSKFKKDGVIASKLCLIKPDILPL
jgi:hypothetical protein